jgi:hypothetical protein
MPRDAPSLSLVPTATKATGMCASALICCDRQHYRYVPYAIISGDMAGCHHQPYITDSSGSQVECS